MAKRKRQRRLTEKEFQTLAEAIAQIGPEQRSQILEAIDKQLAAPPAPETARARPAKEEAPR